MSYYTRGNLAVDIDRRSTAKNKKRTVKIKSAIPTGEKLFYLFLIVMVVVVTGFIGIRYVQISKYNHEIQALKSEIVSIKEESGTIQMKIEQMSNRDRITHEAERLGMVQMQAGAIRIVGKSKQPQAAQTGQN